MTADAVLTLDRDGAERLPGRALAALATLETIAGRHPAILRGVRLHGDPVLRRLVATDGPIGSAAAAVLGPHSQAVRAILFDKRADANWSLGWHQDRVISVVVRHPVAGYGPWTRKHGMPHVQPPFAILARMITVRCHLDDVPADNAPLLVAPGSHRQGRIAEADIAAAVAACGTATCLADAGDVWVYATPVLHASDRAVRPVRRRVLQIDFSVDVLPGGLEWFGV